MFCMVFENYGNIFPAIAPLSHPTDCRFESKNNYTALK